MNDDLVTVAAFAENTQAVVVRNFLEEAGIPAFLMGEMSQTLFVVGGPTGGVRIQVPESRLEEAIRLINERWSGEAGPVDWSQVDVGEAEDEPTDDDIATSLKAEKTPGPAPAEEVELSDLTLREQRANRIVRGAFLGLLFWPVLILAVWRLIQIANSKERLRPEYQRKANIAALIIAVPLLLILFSCCLIPMMEMLERY
jgi:hypothetical protein